MAIDIEERIRQINARLKAGKVGVSVQRRRDRLCLRGTLPPRPGSTKDRSFRQEIYLGVYCNSAGFTYAENETKLVGSLLAKHKFSWEPYLHTKRLEKQLFTALLLNLWEKYVGCAWRLLPKHYPPYSTVYYYFRALARRRQLEAHS